MVLRSSSFEAGQALPRRHGKRFGNVSPPLSWQAVPSGTRSFALSMVDQISDRRHHVHWLVTDLPVTVVSLEEGASGARLPGGSRELKGYVGPFPPSGMHRYRFTVYALRTETLDLPEKVTLEAFTGAAEAAALASSGTVVCWTPRAGDRGARWPADRARIVPIEGTAPPPAAHHGGVTALTPPAAAPHPDGGDPGRALAALRTADPVLAALIDRTGPVDLAAWRARWSRGRFESLAGGIVGKQIATRAATAIYDRLIGLIDGRDPAQAIVEASDGELRLVGLSRAKVAALRDLAARMLDGRLELERLHDLTDAEVRSQLIAVRGIGPWTADLFLIGQLGREDVLPAGDLGLRHAIQALYHLDHVPSPREVEAMGERWRPYRTLATAYLYEAIWRRGLQAPTASGPDAQAPAASAPA